MSEDYFIRAPDTEDMRGPFDMDQLATLAGAGKVTAETLFYIEGEGEWKPLKEVEALYDTLIPKEDTIKLKLVEPQAPVVSIPNKDDSEAEAGVTVNDMLASAEGRTEETQHLRRKEKEKNSAASLSMPVLGLSFLLVAFATGWSHFAFLEGVINERNWVHLLSRPIVFVFFVDVVLGLAMLLSASEVFPLVRLRASLGLGFFVYFFWSLQGYDYACAAGAFSIGVMFCTLTLSLPSMILGAVCALAGSSYLAFHGFTGDLPEFLLF